MKTKLHTIFILAFFMLCTGLVSAQAQTALPYKITKIKLLPFDGSTGRFQDEIKTKDERDFFNQLDLSLLVTIEVSGQVGSYVTERMVEITVLEGKKQKVKKTEVLGIIGESGKYHIPLWLNSGICQDITVTARLIGQKNTSVMTRKAVFYCGE